MSTVFVQRSGGAGTPIIGVYLNQQSYATEALDSTDPAVVAYFARRVPRPLYQIYNDLKALTAAQQTAVWNDISAGTPAKYLLDIGGNAGALVALDWAARFSGAAGAALAEAQFRAVALYCQDVPGYLVNPAFAPTVNVPGDAPAP